jgi:vancomycin resistance protein YoaR
VVVFGALFLLFELSTSKYTDLSGPRQFLHNTNISGKSPEEVEQLLPVAFENYLEERTIFDFGNGNTIVMQNKDLDPVLDSEATLNNISYYAGKPTFRQYFKNLIAKNDKNLVLDFDPDAIINIIDETSTKIKLTANAYFDVTKDGEVFIHPEVNGQGIDHEELVSKLQSRSKLIKIKPYHQDANITSADLEAHRTTYQNLISSPVILSASSSEFLLDFRKNPGLLDLKFEQEVPHFVINTVELARFISENLSKSVEKHPKHMRISLVANKGKFTGSSELGVKIDIQKLAEELNKYLTAQNTNQIVIPLITVEPTVQISEELQNRGIKELHTSIYTTFHGSAVNRTHNVITGATKFNGLIIKKGETFSFNDNLGEVDATTGFLPELVIKAEGTIPEYGGGLCQVSTTLYRTALFAGLKIVERSPHSYAVGYYDQVLGPGLDATIYPGAKDLRFKNDTPGDLLIESFVEGAKITFNFYGTKDGRTVTVDDLKVSEKTSSNESVYVVKNDLPPGTIKRIERAAPGFKTSWTRTIQYSNGTKHVETLFSNYRTAIDKFLVSPDKDPNVSNLLNSPLPPLDESGAPRI